MQPNLILSKLDRMIQQQTKQLTELRANLVTILVTVSPLPTDHAVESDFDLIVEEGANEVIAHNIEKIIEQLSI